MKTLKPVKDIPHEEIKALVKNIKWTKYHNRIWVRIMEENDIKRVLDHCEKQ